MTMQKSSERSTVKKTIKSLDVNYTLLKWSRDRLMTFNSDNCKVMQTKPTMHGLLYGGSQLTSVRNVTKRKTSV